MDIENAGFLDIANIYLDELELKAILFDPERNITI